MNWTICSLAGSPMWPSDRCDLDFEKDQRGAVRLQFELNRLSDLTHISAKTILEVARIMKCVFARGMKPINLICCSRLYRS